MSVFAQRTKPERRSGQKSRVREARRGARQVLDNFFTQQRRKIGYKPAVEKSTQKRHLGRVNNIKGTILSLPSVPTYNSFELSNIVDWASAPPPASRLPPLVFKELLTHALVHFQTAKKKALVENRAYFFLLVVYIHYVQRVKLPGHLARKTWEPRYTQTRQKISFLITRVVKSIAGTGRVVTERHATHACRKTHRPRK